MFAYDQSGQAHTLINVFFCCRAHAKRTSWNCDDSHEPC